MKTIFKNNWMAIPLLLLITASLVAQNQGQQIVLSKNTLKDYTIVVYNQTSNIQRKSAKELQHYLNLIFQIKPKIKSRQAINRNGHYFLLGEGFLSDSLRNTDTLVKDAFVKAFRNGNIYLGGKDDLDVRSVKAAFFRNKEQANLGTLYATYDFLETELGVHWFFPTYLGEFIPAVTTVYIEESLVLKSPVFEERTFGIKYLYFDLDTAMTWLIRNKAGISNMKLYNHNWSKLIPADVFMDSRPDLFAISDRNHAVLTNSNQNPQLCTSNEELIHLFIKQSKEYLKKHPSEHYFSVSPNDNKKFCRCNDCVNLDATTFINPKYSHLSNRIFGFYSQVADSIRKDYPKLQIGAYAYKAYAVYTPKDTLPDYFHIRLAINNFGLGNKNCSTLDTLLQIVQSWERKPNTGFYSFPYGNTWVYPYLKTKIYQNLIIALANNHFHKIRFTFIPDWYTQGLDIWLISKMLWNPEVNVDSLKKIYYQSVYPETYPIVHHFHNTLQRRINKTDVCVPSYSLAGKRRTKKLFLELFPEELLNKTNRQLQTKLTNGGLSIKEKENVSNFIKMLDFLIVERQAYSQSIYGGLLLDKAGTTAASNKIMSLKNSLILSAASKYWNPEKTPSVLIGK